MWWANANPPRRRARSSNWQWSQMVYKKDWGTSLSDSGWVQFQKVTMGLSKAAQRPAQWLETSDLWSSFFLSLFHLENCVGSTPTCDLLFFTLRSSWEASDMPCVPCRQQGSAAFSLIFLMETKQGFALNTKKHPSSRMEKITVS